MEVSVGKNNLMNMSYGDVLKMGFLLNWNTDHCDGCEISGGRCGFENNEFVCFCLDGPHQRTCTDGNYTG